MNQMENKTEEKQIAIIAARFNSQITDQLVKGAIDLLSRNGIKKSNIHLFWVPGAFEIPLMCQKVFNNKNVDGIIALGAIIRGETPHFDFVAGECTKGIMNVSLAADKPVSFGVLTTDTVEQALNRAGLKYGNKGEDAASALLFQLKVFEEAGFK